MALAIYFLIIIFFGFSILMNSIFFFFAFSISYNEELFEQNAFDLVLLIFADWL